MYTTQRNVQVTVSLLKAHGISDIVLSPGSRNMGFVRSVETDPFFTTYSVVDERSAAYFAIGLYLETGRPVVINCTSAQATRNYIPGMTEAYYRNIPLVVVTADYKPSLIGQGTMQALDQMSIPRDSAKASVLLPVVVDDLDENYCVRLVNEALLELHHDGPGPVHINIPTPDHWPGGTRELSEFRRISRITSDDPFPRIGSRRVLVAVGQHQPFDEATREALDRFAEKFNCVVYVNPLSNYSGPRSLQANLILEGMDRRTFDLFAPDLLITIGGQMGDYAFDSRIRVPAFEHWSVTQDGKVRDTYSKLSSVFKMTEKQFLLASVAHEADPVNVNEYFELWRDACARRVVPETLPLSHALVAATLAPKLIPNSVVHFGILSSFRNWAYHELPSHSDYYCNVAAFGIDGCVSTFVGQACGNRDRQTILVVGDLSFFYDMNALGIRHLGANARVVMVNNGGGGEFQLYSNPATEFGAESDRHIAATGHFGSAEGWVRSRGWRYIRVDKRQHLAAALDTLLGQSDVPVFVEVFTTMDDDSDAVRMLVAANSSRSLEGKLVAALSPKSKRRIKKYLRR